MRTTNQYNPDSIFNRTKDNTVLLPLDKIKKHPNVPISGIRLDGFRDGCAWFSDPRGFRKNITVERLNLFLPQAQIEDHVITSECIWAMDGKKETLLVVGSEPYNLAMQNYERKNSNVPLKDLLIGDHVVMKDAQEYIYLGKGTLSFTETFEFDKCKIYPDEVEHKTTKSLHAFFRLESQTRFSNVNHTVMLISRTSSIAECKGMHPDYSNIDAIHSKPIINQDQDSCRFTTSTNHQLYVDSYEIFPDKRHSESGTIKRSNFIFSLTALNKQ